MLPYTALDLTRVMERHLREDPPAQASAADAAPDAPPGSGDAGSGRAPRHPWDELARVFFPARRSRLGPEPAGSC